jgi:hypothetical protein
MPRELLVEHSGEVATGVEPLDAAQGQGRRHLGRLEQDGVAEQAERDLPIPVFERP